MDKPITIRYEEFKSKLEELINDSCLPPFIIEPVMKEYLEEVHKCSMVQYQKDKLVYETSMQNIVNEGDSNDFSEIDKK